MPNSVYQITTTFSTLVIPDNSDEESEPIQTPSRRSTSRPEPRSPNRPTATPAEPDTLHEPCAHSSTFISVGTPNRGSTRATRGTPSRGRGGGTANRGGVQVTPPSTWYAVTKGRAVGVVPDWELAGALCNTKKWSARKFLTKEEAFAYFMERQEAGDLQVYYE